jgi:hypothetical protein
MTEVAQQALRAARRGCEMELIRSLIDRGDEAAIKTAVEVWFYGEQSQIAKGSAAPSHTPRPGG